MSKYCVLTFIKILNLQPLWKTYIFSNTLQIKMSNFQSDFDVFCLCYIQSEIAWTAAMFV